MDIEKFAHCLSTANCSEKERASFQVWIARYGKTVPRINGRLPVTRESVTEFLGNMQHHGVTASRRLQALRAIESYRRFVLGRSSPILRDIGERLSRYAAQERIARRSLRKMQVLIDSADERPSESVDGYRSSVA